ncbi:MAG: Ribonuclease HII, partial [uncultured Solirubrobacteraceae bacterium]
GGRRRGRPRVPRGAARRRGGPLRLRAAEPARPALALRAERLQAALDRDARGALPARAARGDRRRGDLPLLAGDRRARPARHEPPRAVGHAAPGRPRGLRLPERRLPRPGDGLRAAPGRGRGRDERRDRRRLRDREGHARPLHAARRGAVPRLGVRRPCRVLDARAPRRDRAPGRLPTAPHVLPVRRLPAARAV